MQETWYQPGFGEGASLNEYFYGVHVTHETETESYAFQTDTISVNYRLDDTSFWNRQHLFRIEWEPPSLEDGSGGYIHWFIDNQFVASIEGEELQRVSQTEIPSEPMYLIMNLAVSRDWSFPDAWFLGCEHKCWSCFDPNCQCALPVGYCETFPARFEIGHVRVYQATKDPKHTVGCSPILRPTADFMEAHKYRYMAHDDNGTEPLLPIVNGGVSCLESSDCGNHGRCKQFTCQCHQGWAGPTCLAHDPFHTSRIYSDGRSHLFVFALLLALTTIIFCLAYMVRNRTDSERVLYDLLSDIEAEKTTMSNREMTPPETSSESLALDSKQEHFGYDSYQNGRDEYDK